MPVSWLEHRGQRILYADFRGLGETECLDTLHEHLAALDAAARPVLTLVDARGTFFDAQFFQLAKAAAPQATARTRRRAVVGVEGIKQVLLMLYNHAAEPVPAMPCATVDEALAYLTEP
jgi:hypothetical protein